MHSMRSLLVVASLMGYVMAEEGVITVTDPPPPVSTKAHFRHAKKEVEIGTR